MAAKLLVGKKITPHVDRHQSFHRSHRIHVPITTNPRVRFTIDGQSHQLKVGEAYEINKATGNSLSSSKTSAMDAPRNTLARQRHR
ncbi:MAG: aspartyl/asparaginyl beta-hydroxylase domain-containing protein [Proteobacteria bacterium]|nr:aspartyl/asparaginyl beta-hydroxylase domain-containing protein [Pseudomonadota bacterium]